MRTPGTGEILLILLLCVVVFSASKVNALGDAVGAFWQGLRGGSKPDALPTQPDERPRDDA